MIIVYILLIKLNNKKFTNYLSLVLVLLLPCTVKSMTVVYNEFSNYIARLTGYYLPEFATTASSIPITLVLTSIAGVTLYRMVEKRWISPYILSFLFVIAWQVYSKQAASFLLNSVLLILLLGCIVSAKFTLRKNNWLEIGGLLFFCILLLATSSFIPEKHSNLHEQTAQAIQHSLYNRQPIDWKTDGDMTRISQAYTTNKEALKIIMEQPTAIYLKGFIGSTYTNNKWTLLSNEAYYYAQPLLTSLKKENFTSETILAENYRQTTNEQASSVRVFPKQASKKYGYAPYELLTPIKSTSLKRDGILSATTWAKASSYQYEIMDKARVMYPVTAQQTRNEEFLAAEAHYNEFVYKNYLQVTKEDQKIIESHYPKERPAISSYADAIKEVQTYLQKNMRFEKNTKAITSKDNFVQMTLENTKRGFSPHYATIATLVFRDLHIPARYVEGYIVTKDQVQDKKPYSEISVRGKEAHAWTEIYINQLGWVPVEVTPGFEKKIPKLETPIATNQATKSISQVQSKNVQTPGEQAGEKEVIEDKSVTIEPQPKKKKEAGSYWLLASISGLFLVVLAFFIYIYIKRKTVRTLKKAQQSKDLLRRTKANMAYIEWQFEHILQLTRPAQSLYSWLDILPKNYTRAMKNLIEEYQKISYGQAENTDDFEYYMKQVQNSIHRPLTIANHVKYYLRGTK